MKAITETERLQSELLDAKQELQQLEKRLKQKPEYNLGEGAALTYSWELTLAQKEVVQARIEALQSALVRSQEGTYGCCENCGAQINPERLDILPAATLCAPCAELHA